MLRYFDLDLDLQTSEFEYMRSFRRGIRIVGPQEVKFESRPSLLRKAYPTKKCLLTIVWDNYNNYSPPMIAF